MSEIAVVDASVTILLFLDEPESANAWKLFWCLAEPEPPLFFAPDLMYIECANILWKYTRRSGYDARQAQENLEDLAKLEIESVPTRELSVRAYELAQRQGVTAYDACYVVLAQGLDCPLITLDQSLAQKIPESLATVRWLPSYLTERSS
ncbi:type II toxin-antitoxin system VapC family toxin [Candidatus Acetothermia bacterium]|nr:type II toxin-antitoxin system VapC family toxin [Candidatus Acetothermia bacterium]MBI3659279.1 type II toxin-antitoxin system VapC family toxin [Candidatus Acetothermia bacterium]